MTFYAHTKQDPHGAPLPQDQWEPLFTPWRDRPGHLSTSPETCTINTDKLRSNHLDQVISIPPSLNA